MFHPQDTFSLNSVITNCSSYDQVTRHVSPILKIRNAEF
ncbi:MAG: hypothetical protein ACI86M_000870 [Saprospiraceae bacterium]|jgi:hypothetical protein